MGCPCTKQRRYVSLSASRGDSRIAPTRVLAPNALATGIGYVEQGTYFKKGVKARRVKRESLLSEKTTE